MVGRPTAAQIAEWAGELDAVAARIGPRFSRSEPRRRAAEYAYDALRAHFDDKFARGQYLAYFLKLNGHCQELRIGGRADRGLAACYHERRDKADHWAVIEDGPDPDLGRDEYALDHPVSKAFAGHPGRAGRYACAIGPLGTGPGRVVTRRATPGGARSGRNRVTPVIRTAEPKNCSLRAKCRRKTRHYYMTGRSIYSHHRWRVRILRLNRESRAADRCTPLTFDGSGKSCYSYVAQSG